MVIPRPTTRLLALLEVLQSRDLVSGTELARRLEIDGRSVRRYITMLEEIGILVETVRGPRGGYRLRPGSRIPPLLLTEDEAVALALVLGTIPHLGLALAPETTTGLRAKLERTLPMGLRGRIRALAESITLAPSPPAILAEGALLAALGEAANGGHRLRLRYRANNGTETTRLVDPYGVARWSRAWYLVAHCHLRSGVRVFRLDRIAAAEPTAERFTPPQDFDAYAQVARAMRDYPGRWTADIHLELPLAAMRDTPLAPYGTLMATGAGTRFQGRFDDLDGLARWLIALGCAFTIAEPPELRTALRRLAREVAALAETGSAATLQIGAGEANEAEREEKGGADRQQEPRLPTRPFHDRSAVLVEDREVEQPLRRREEGPEQIQHVGDSDESADEPTERPRAAPSRAEIDQGGDWQFEWQQPDKGGEEVPCAYLQAPDADTDEGDEPEAEWRDDQSDQGCAPGGEVDPPAWQRGAEDEFEVPGVEVARPAPRDGEGVAGQQER